MIKTYKIKHEKDFHQEIRLAKKVARYAIGHKSSSSKDVKCIGLKSALSNQILRKYGRSKTVKVIKSVKLTVPGQSIKVNKANRDIIIPCLKFNLNYLFPNDFEKINQIEFGYKYAYVSVTIPDSPQIETDKFIGVDLNATGHCAVVAVPETNKVYMLGKKAQHIHTKYSRYRKRFQRLGAFRLLSKAKRRESNIVKDLNHKISKKIVQVAIANHAGIKLEDLTGIRNNKKQAKSFRYTLNSWSFYQLKQFVEYKAKKQGIPVVYIEPAYTSQTCSKCGSLGDRKGKSFKCPVCGHTTHADINAAYNIAASIQVVDGRAKKGLSESSLMFDVPIEPYTHRSAQEKDCVEGCTDQPQVAPSLQVR
jgi:transposase, IS605 OrfB family, central region